MNVAQVNVAQLIKERRSVHLFEDRTVSVELIKELLDTATWVPNHRMTQPWRFVIVNGDGRKKIAEIAREINEKKAQDPQKAKEIGQTFYDKMMAVPMFVVVLMKEDPSITVREEDYASTSCLIHNFSLLAWEQNLGMVWKTYALMNHPSFREVLGIGLGEKVVGSLHVGYPAKIPTPKPRVSVEELITVVE
ncbi:nitroreductase family protein [Risungbinella massiliensis]|uniref:nitroreductase family protein n=1 Tax=Risungbinella massiliensis TaxID=1329796 RepID=UPI0005CBC03D|nr:nitroreductase [Risungbinella massiliensis]